MVRKAFKPEQSINKLREAEVLLSQGSTVGEASRKLGVTEQTYYRWRKEYGGMRVAQAKRLQELEKENTRLKKLVADVSLDNAKGETIRKEADLLNGSMIFRAINWQLKDPYHTKHRIVPGRVQLYSISPSLEYIY